MTVAYVLCSRSESSRQPENIRAEKNPISKVQTRNPTFFDHDTRGRHMLGSDRGHVQFVVRIKKKSDYIKLFVNSFFARNLMSVSIYSSDRYLAQKKLSMISFLRTKICHTADFQVQQYGNMCYYSL